MTDGDATYDRLKQLALSMGADLFGVADLGRVRADTDLLDACFDNFTRGISLGAAVDEAALEGIVGGPTLEYSREYRRVNKKLDEIAEAIEARLEAAGADAVRIPASEVIDWDKLKGRLSHKLIGRYAGHGWIGKNILLVNPEFGSRVRYATVLTDAPLEADAPIEADCGDCSRCVVLCPAGAANNDQSRFDLRACFNKLAEFNERLDEPHFICGICVKACRGEKLLR